MIRDPRVGPVDMSVDRRTKRRVVGQLPTQGWDWEDKTGKKKKTNKKREKEAVSGFLRSELGTHCRRGGAGSHGGVLGLISGVGSGNRGPAPWGIRVQGAERAQERPLSKPREALAHSLCHPALTVDPLGPWPCPQALDLATGPPSASLVATLCPLEAEASREPSKRDPQP